MSPKQDKKLPRPRTKFKNGPSQSEGCTSVQSEKPVSVEVTANQLIVNYPLPPDAGVTTPCRCGTGYYCIPHSAVEELIKPYIPIHDGGPQNDLEVDCLNTEMSQEALRPSTMAKRSFPTTRRLVRRELDKTHNLEFLDEWRRDKGIKVGTGLTEEQHLRLLHVLWTYRDVEAEGVSDMGPPTDLLVHRTLVKPGTPIHKAKNQRMAPTKEYWLRKIVTDGLNAGLYELTTVANGFLSPWGANPVLVTKQGKDPIHDEPRLTCNYHWLFEEKPGNQMELSERTLLFLAHPSHGRFMKADLKNGYWAVEVHPDDRYYLAFNVPGIGQVQPTRMAQGARSSSFTMNELGAIAFGEIPAPDPEPSLLHSTPEQMQDLVYYVDDIFGAHKTIEDQLHFIEHHFFPRILWSRLKLSFKKLELLVQDIVALGERHVAGGMIRPTPERLRKIAEWPTPTDAKGVRSFLGTIGKNKKYIKNYSEIARPLFRLLGSKVPFRWDQAESVSFEMIKARFVKTISVYGWIPTLPSHMYVDSSGFGVGCYVCQLQNGEWRPILYDSVLLTKSERNYDTYKRELKAIVTFAKKYSFMLQGYQTSVIFTDHQPLLGFINSRTHQDIFARWVQVLRALNIKLERVEGERNQMADGLSRTIFDMDCNPSEVTETLQRKLEDPDDPWLWKSGVGGYEHWLKSMDVDHRKKAIEEAETRHASVNAQWTTFGEPTPYLADAEGSTMQADCYAVDTGATDNMDVVRERWYGDMTKYYKHQYLPKDWSKAKQVRFKAKIRGFRWDKTTDKLLHQVGHEWVPCIGPEEVQPLLDRTHDRNGHFSTKILHEKLRHRVWWPGMVSDMHKYVRSCLACVRASQARRVKPLVPIRSLRPFHVLVIDFIEGLPETPAGNTTIFNIVDYFSRYCMARPVRSTLGFDAASVMNRVFDQYTTPIVIFCDQDGAFTAGNFQSLLKNRGVVLDFIPSKSHRSAGLIESHNKILQWRLQTTQELNSNLIEEAVAQRREVPNIRDTGWDRRLGGAIFAMNHRHIAEIGYSPIEISLGVTSGELLDLEDDYPSKSRTEVLAVTRCETEPFSEDHMTEAIHDFMARRVTRNKLVHAENTRVQTLRSRYFDQDKETRVFTPGDYVLKHTPVMYGKLNSPWEGPFKVAERLGPDSNTYRIESITGQPLMRLSGLVHADRLRKIAPREGHLLPRDKISNTPQTGIELTGEWRVTWEPDGKKSLKQVRKTYEPVTSKAVIEAKEGRQKVMTPEIARSLLQEQEASSKRKSLKPKSRRAQIGEEQTRVNSIEADVESSSELSELGSPDFDEDGDWQEEKSAKVNKDRRDKVLTGRILKSSVKKKTKESKGTEAREKIPRDNPPDVDYETWCQIGPFKRGFIRSKSKSHATDFSASTYLKEGVNVPDRGGKTGSNIKPDNPPGISYAEWCHLTNKERGYIRDRLTDDPDWDVTRISERFGALGKNVLPKMPPGVTYEDWCALSKDSRSWITGQMNKDPKYEGAKVVNLSLRSEASRQRLEAAGIKHYAFNRVLSEPLPGYTDDQWGAMPPTKRNNLRQKHFLDLDLASEDPAVREERRKKYNDMKRRGWLNYNVSRREKKFREMLSNPTQKLTMAQKEEDRRMRNLQAMRASAAENRIRARALRLQARRVIREAEEDSMQPDELESLEEQSDLEEIPLGEMDSEGKFPAKHLEGLIESFRNESIESFTASTRAWNQLKRIAATYYVSHVTPELKADFKKLLGQAGFKEVDLDRTSKQEVYHNLHLEATEVAKMNKSVWQQMWTRKPYAGKMVPIDEGNEADDEVGTEENGELELDEDERQDPAVTETVSPETPGDGVATKDFAEGMTPAEMEDVARDSMQEAVRNLSQGTTRGSAPEHALDLLYDDW